MGNTVTVRPSPTPFTPTLKVDALPSLPDDDYPLQSLVVCKGQVYRACVGEWTHVVEGWEIVGSGDAWGTVTHIWPGYETLEGKHGALREARQLAEKFGADILIERPTS